MWFEEKWEKWKTDKYANEDNLYKFKKRYQMKCYDNVKHKRKWY